eukprot:1147317-Pelagomonas_calceolata.AAC.7
MNPDSCKRTLASCTLRRIASDTKESDQDGPWEANPMNLDSRKRTLARCGFAQLQGGPKEK